MRNQGLLAVRKSQEKDSEFIVDSQIKMAFETEGVQLDLPTIRKGVAALFEDPSKGQYFVASEKCAEGREQLVACVLTIPEWSDWRNGTVLWIHSLYVVPAARNRGIYRKMYAFLQERVQTAPELRGLRLYVDKRNVSAQKVYQKLGMSNEHYEMFEWMKTW